LTQNLVFENFKIFCDFFVTLAKHWLKIVPIPFMDFESVRKSLYSFSYSSFISLQRYNQSKPNLNDTAKQLEKCFHVFFFCSLARLKLFGVLQEKNPDALEKMVAVEGDVGAFGLGLTS
jgi:hypothetical protein